MSVYLVKFALEDNNNKLVIVTLIVSPVFWSDLFEYKGNLLSTNYGNVE